MKAAIYIRVSTEEQARHGYSLGDQRERAIAYCKFNKIENYELYEDAGKSGGSLVRRSELKRLMRDVKTGDFDTVLILSITRFARNLRDFVILAEELDELGINLISLSEAFDSRTPAGRLIRGILAVVAEWERDETSERVREIAYYKAMKGDRTCGLTLGYDLIPKGHMHINKEESERVLFIFREYRHCKCLNRVSQMCEEKGIRGKKGATLKPWHILRILVNFTYCGFYPFHREPMLASYGKFPAIMSIKEFNTIQNILIRQGKASGKGLEKRMYKVQGGEKLIALIWKQSRTSR